MQVEIKLDNSCSEPKAIIITDKITDEINRTANLLSGAAPQLITGFSDDMAEIIEPAEIIRVYCSVGKVFLVTSKKEYTIRSRLYELEERLDKTNFVRISNSEIINIKKVLRFDLSITGTILCLLENKTTSYVSRRYVSKIKQVLGI